MSTRSTEKPLVFLKCLLLALSLTVSCSDDSSFNGSAKKKSSSKKIDSDSNLQPAKTEIEKSSETTAEASGTEDPALDGEATGPGVQELNIATETFEITAQKESKPVDIAFFVDTSGSMRDEANEVIKNMQGFLASFATLKLTNFTITIVSNINNIQLNDPSIRTLSHRIGSSNALEETMVVIQNGSLALGQDSIKEFIYVTDDNGNGAEEFSDFIQAQDTTRDKTSLSGIVWIDGVSQQSPTCSRADNGVAYQELSKTLTRKGIILDLCSKNWDAVFKDLAKKIVFDVIETTFKLEKAPKIKSLKISIEGLQLENGKDFSYDPNENTVKIKDEILAESLGKKITISFLEQEPAP